MKLKPVAVLLGALVVLAWCLCSPGVLAGQTAAEQVVLVLWHGLTMEDAAILRLQGPVALGLLNTRAGGGDSLSAAYLSIGAGARAVGWRGAAAFQPREVAEHLYRRNTGLEPGVYIQPDIALIWAAQDVSYRVELGALGTSFLEAGEGVRVLGNSSGSSDYHWGALTAMDSFGRIWQGEIDTEFLTADPRYPFGVRTDYAQLAQAVWDAEERLIVVDLGDPFRCDLYQEYLLPEQRETVRAVMVGEAAGFVEGLSRERPEGTVLILISPHPPLGAAREGKWLTPVILVGLQEGLLISATTRWPGIITNMDVAPTILRLLQISHTQPFIGRAAAVKETGDARNQLAAMAGKISALSRCRSLVLRLVVIAQIGVYTAVLVSLILSSQLPDWTVRALQSALLALLSTPLALLFWDISPLLSALILLVVILGGMKYPRPLLLVGVVSLLTSAALSVDILSDSRLMRYSPLGYDPVGGARFYGIGNEYMGVLVGSSIMAWAIFAGGRRERWVQLLGLALFAGLIVLIGAPPLGTNAGGAISAVFGFAVVWLGLAGIKRGWVSAAAAAFCAVLVLGLFAWLDSANPEDQQSHIGQAAELFRRDGASALLLIIQRKLEMNLRLLRYSIWSRALIVTLAAMSASFIWPSKFISWLKKNHPAASKGIGGVVLGAVAALIFNDSGVVAAATCISFGSSPLLLLALGSKHDLTAPQAHVENDSHRHQTGDHGTPPSSDKGEGKPSNGHDAQGHTHINDQMEEENAGSPRG
jgi:hypothetical protein